MGRSVSIHEISYCLLLLLCPLLLHCSCFAHCRHDPFIVRSASNLSTFLRFHSVCASLSMFAIDIDNCPFRFLFLLLFLVSSESASEFSVYTYRGFCVPRGSVFVSGLQPRNQIHHRLRQPSSCSGVWDHPWSCRIPIFQFE